MKQEMGEVIVDLLDRLVAYGAADVLRIVECGTIRKPTFEDHDDGLATIYVAQWIKDRGPILGHFHEFYSFELSAGTLKDCREFLREHELDQFVQFGLGDADLLLQHLCLPIDFCYLDAGADPVENLSQYRRAEKWMRKPGLILIDDVFDPRNADRGLVTVPYARMEGRKVAKISGRQALISFGADDFPLPKGSVWLK